MSAVQTAEPAVPTLDLQALSAWVEEQLPKFNVPGLELAIVAGGQVLFTGGFGRRDVEADFPVGATTLFSHGSTGKAFTAFLASQLVEEGLLDLDRPIREYLPGFRLHDALASERVTARDFLLHRSGLPRHELTWMTRQRTPRSEIVEAMRHLEPSRDFRQVFQYCNLGYMAVGHLIGVLTGSTFEAELRRRVFEPLGMTNTFASIDEAEATGDMALPYSNRNDELKPLARRHGDNLAPAGGINSCARDTARWLQVQLGGGELDGRRILSEPLFKQTHQVQLPIAGMPAAQDSAVQMHGYAFGWMVGSFRGRRHVHHGGTIDGFSTDFELLPDDGIAVAACTNSGSALPTAVCRQVFDLLLGESDRDWAGRMQEQMERMRKTMAERREAVTKAATTVEAGPAHALDDYVGTYENPGYGPLEVAVEDGALAVTLGENKLFAKHLRYETWDLKLPGFEELPLNVNFFTDPAGLVSRAYASLESSLPEPIVFRRRVEVASTDLEKLVGKFSFGPVEVEAKLAGKRLVVVQNGTEAELKPEGGLRFSVPAQPGLTLEFVLGEDGVAQELKTNFGSARRV